MNSSVVLFAPAGPWKRNSEMIRSPAFGAGGAASSFVIVRVAAVGAPSVAPVAPLIVRPTVSSFSKRDSLQGVTLKVFDAPSVSAQLSVPLLLMKSTPGVQAVPPTA